MRYGQVGAHVHSEQSRVSAIFGPHSIRRSEYGPSGQSTSPIQAMHVGRPTARGAQTSFCAQPPPGRSATHARATCSHAGRSFVIVCDGAHASVRTVGPPLTVTLAIVE